MPALPPEPRLRVVPRAQRSDGELIAAVLAGQASLAAEFHDRVHPPVMRTLRGLLRGSEAEHEDLAQVAMLEMITTLDRFRGECPLERWASRVAAHTAFKYIRRRKAERKIFHPVELAELSIPGEERPERQLMFRGVVRRIRQHLEQMDVNRAMAFVLHDVYGYDLEEIAQITEASVSAAQSRLIRGRRELHLRVEQEPDLARALEREGEG